MQRVRQAVNAERRGQSVAREWYVPTQRPPGTRDRGYAALDVGGGEEPPPFLSSRARSRCLTYVVDSTGTRSTGCERIAPEVHATGSAARTQQRRGSSPSSGSRRHSRAT